LSKRFKIIVNYIIGPILFVWVCYTLYSEISRQDNLEQKWQTLKTNFFGPQQWKFITVILLMLVNWGIEARKWQVLMQTIQKLSFWRAYKAVFSGQSLAINTPNRVGEYVGRVVYLNDGNRLRGIALTIVGSFSQTLVTLIAGVIGCIIIRTDARHQSIPLPFFNDAWLQVTIYFSASLTLLLLITYYNLSWLTKLLERIPFVKKYSFFIQKLEDLHWRELTRILSLSLFRFVVYAFQFILLLHAFGVDIEAWRLFWLISVFYFALMLPPTVTIVEGSIRAYLAATIFGLYSGNILAIEFASLGLWFINLIMPAMAGSLFIFGVKLFKKK